MVVDIADLVTYTSFGDHRLRGFWVAGGQISLSPIDSHRRPYNTLALPCERVIEPQGILASKICCEHVGRRPVGVLRRKLFHDFLPVVVREHSLCIQLVWDTLDRNLHFRD